MHSQLIFISYLQKINTTTGDDNEVVRWTLTPSGSNEMDYNNIDGTPFYLSNTGTRSGISDINTLLISPSFSTLGYPVVELSYNYRFLVQNSVGNVQMSTDSITWTTVKQYTANSSATYIDADNFTLPAAYGNKAKVWLRFQHTGEPAYLFAIDNVAVKGRKQGTVTWTPTTRLYTDSTYQHAYTGTATSTVYFNPAAGNYVYTATATATNGCSTSGTTSFTVTATPVTPTITANTPVCTGNTLNLSTASVANAAYSWTGPNGFVSTSQNPSIANTTSAAGGTYKLIESVNGCTSDTGRKVVVVNQTPAAFVVTPAQSSVCAGSTVALSAGNSTVILSQDFEGAVDWTNVNTSTGDYAFQADWQLMPSGYFYNNEFFNSNDGSYFYISKSSEHSIFGATHTQLVSPSFSTVGFSTVTFSFYHYYDHYPSSSATVDVSTDNVNWTTLKTYTSTTGASYSFAHEVATLPAAFVGKSTVYVRFKYDAADGYYWAVDNVSIVGSNTVPVTWAPLTGLYNEAAAQTAYTGTARSSVFVKRAAGSYSYIATVTNGTCTFKDTALVVMKPTTDAGYNYRTIASGSWNDPTIWEVSKNNTTFSATCASPAGNATSITIRSGHTVTVTANVTAAKTTVAAGGNLVIGSGVVLTTK